MVRILLARDSDDRAQADDPSCVAAHRRRTPSRRRGKNRQRATAVAAAKIAPRTAATATPFTNAATRPPARAILKHEKQDGLQLAFLQLAFLQL
jgi:hypothetical protein